MGQDIKVEIKVECTMSSQHQPERNCKANLTLSCHDQDKSVEINETVTRRISPRFIIYDPNLGDYRPTSQAFQNSESNHPMSVGIRSMLKSPEEDLIGYNDMSLVELDVKLLRALAQGVCKCPTRHCPWHGLACGNKTGSVRSAISKSARWLVRRPPAHNGPKAASKQDPRRG